MRRAIRTSVRLFAESFEPRGPVVELGSYHTPDWAWLADLRPLFPGREYIGCDIRQGPGVDRVEDAQRLTFADGSVGAVLLLEILEHLRDPSRAVAEAHRVLRDDGVLAVSVPFHFRLHGAPTDYWRFTASGMDALLAPFPERLVFALGPRLKPALVFAVAGKSGVRDFAARGALFRSAVHSTFGASRLRGHLSVLKERGRDFFGALLGRAELAAEFFDPAGGGGYADPTAAPGAPPSAAPHEAPPRPGARAR